MVELTNIFGILSESFRIGGDNTNILETWLPALPCPIELGFSICLFLYFRLPASLWHWGEVLLRTGAKIQFYPWGLRLMSKLAKDIKTISSLIRMEPGPISYLLVLAGMTYSVLMLLIKKSPLVIRRDISSSGRLSLSRSTHYLQYIISRSSGKIKNW